MRLIIMSKGDVGSVPVLEVVPVPHHRLLLVPPLLEAGPV